MGRPKSNNIMDKCYTIRMDDSTLARLEVYCNHMQIWQNRRQFESYK